MTATGDEFWPVTLAAPSLGVQIRPFDPVTARSIEVIAFDEAGRGPPAAVVLLPVREARGLDRFVIVLDGVTLGEAPSAQALVDAFDDAVQRRACRPDETCHVVQVELAEQARTVLFLLVYAQSTRIGGPHRADLSAFLRTTSGPLWALRNAGIAGSFTASGIAADPASDARFELHLATRLIDFIERTPASGLRRVLLQLPARAAASLAGSKVAHAPQDLSFALASCQYPAGIFDQTPAWSLDAPGPVDASWHRLAALLKGAPDSHPRLVPAFIVLAGDQVYVDATAGLFDPRALDDRFRIPYEKWLALPNVQDVLRRLPAFMVIDDHEIDDNWANDPPPGETSGGLAIGPRRNQRLMGLGRRAYIDFQRGPASVARDDLLWRAPAAGETGGFRFFFGDTRTERCARTALTLNSARIMGDEQRRALYEWLTDGIGAEFSAARPCFVVTPSVFLPRKLASREARAAALHSDAWDGYPAALEELLAFLWTNDLGHVAFLSGDEHLSLVATAVITRSDGPDRRSVTVHSVHSSALYAPYPNANAIAADFAAPNDVIRFTLATQVSVRGRQIDLSGSYECRVTTWFAPGGDGFAVIGVGRSGTGWSLRVEFDRAATAVTRPVAEDHCWQRDFVPSASSAG